MITDLETIKKELYKYFRIESEDKIESLLKSKEKKEVQKVVETGASFGEEIPKGLKIKYEMFRALSFFHHYSVTNQEFILEALMASFQKVKEYDNAF